MFLGAYLDADLRDWVEVVAVEVACHVSLIVAVKGVVEVVEVVEVGTLTRILALPTTNPAIANQRKVNPPAQILYRRARARHFRLAHK